MGSLCFTGRADLLRALAESHGQNADESRDDELARLARVLGLYPQPGEALARQEDTAAHETLTQPDELIEPPAAPPRRRPLQARFFAVLEASKPLSAEQEPRRERVRKALTEEDCRPRNAGEQAMPTLVLRTRLWPALRRSLAVPHLGWLDVPALVRRLARAENVRRLPRCQRREAVGEVFVVVDVARRLIPYESDYLQIIDEVRRLHGAAAIRLWMVSDAPNAPLAVQRGRGRTLAARGPIPVPAAGTPVLILGDLGLLSPLRSAEPAWLDFCRRMRDGGADPVAWVPLSPRLVTREAARHARVHCLGAGDLRSLKVGQAADAPVLAGDLLHTLLTRIACCVRVEPALLRSLRLMSPDTVAEPGLEALVWSRAPEVTAGYRFCEIGQPSQAKYRSAFAALGKDEPGRTAQDEILRRMLAAHAYRGRSTESIEALIWQAHARREAPTGELAVRVAQAVEWVACLGEFADRAPGDVEGYARDLMDRQQTDATWIAAQSRLLAPLWAISGAETVPDGFNPADIAAARRTQESPPLALVQHNDRLYLRPDRGDQSRWPAVSSGGGVGWSERRERIGRWLEFHGDAVELPRSGDPGLAEFWLTADKGLFRFGALSRPPWAQEFGRDIHGLYADADIAGATQRFRYIEPGEFLMGSPDTERERFNDEGPQHLVRLTEGFWLAETACSQAVWAAVTGSNPSRFKDDVQNPVEQVSWDEVQDFLQKVGELLPGVQAELPTEAEWEYACRAGTETAFNWGDGLSPAQANYGGKKAYADGPTGEYRAKTMPVRSFAPNLWGLHQMHGNLWEWCADGLRPYDGRVQENPRGEIGDAVDAPRVTRGGSWDIGPRGLRSARRNQGQRDGSSDYLGFRFCLRPTSPDGCAERLPEAGDFRPLGVEGDRGYLDDVMSVIAPPDNDGGPVPWNALRETLVPSKAKRSKAKKGGKI